MHKLQSYVEMSALYIGDEYWTGETGLNRTPLYSLSDFCSNITVSVKVFISEF